MKRILSGHGLHHSRYYKQQLPIHVLSISAPVTRIRWRPPEDKSESHSCSKGSTVSSPDCDYNHHDSMIAVATSSITGANAGGNGE